MNTGYLIEAKLSHGNGQYVLVSVPEEDFAYKLVVYANAQTHRDGRLSVMLDVNATDAEHIRDWIDQKDIQDIRSFVSKRLILKGEYVNERRSVCADHGEETAVDVE